MALVRYLLLSLLLLPVQAQEFEGIREGEDYIKLENPQAIRSSSEHADKIEVIEFFNYSCPHCFRLQGHLSKWLKQNNKGDIALVHQPVIFPRHEGHFARIYYTLESLGRVEDLNKAVYQALHTDREPILNKNRFLDWLEDKNVDVSQAEAIYDSFSVNTKVILTETIVSEYNVQGTPQMAIDGRYIVNPGLSGSYEEMLETLSIILNKIRQDRK